MARGSRKAATEQTQDGRVRRGALNRERIVAALFALIGEGELMPTAEQVAERAGVGTRTVFRHFADMESLYKQISARMQSEIRPRLDLPEPGPLAERVRGLVRGRSALFERIAAFKRAGNLQRWHSPFIAEEHAALVRLLRTTLQKSLPELASATADVLEAADLLSSFEAWDRLRVDQRLGRERTNEVLEAALLGLLHG